MVDPTATEEHDPDEILKDWSLADGDIAEIRRARGADSRLWAALHLCSLRRTGRFVDDPDTVPRGAIIQLAR